MRSYTPQRILMVFSLISVLTLFGCDGGGDGSDSVVYGERGGVTTNDGTATLRGNISSFETAWSIYEPIVPTDQSRLAKALGSLSEMLLPTAEAAGNREGIVVTIDGPVSKSATTADDGSFEFTELPPGTYALTFEYDGEEVRYRGNSGQVATITLEGETIVEILNLRISGGKVNIGNIKIYKVNDDDSDEDEDED